MTTYNLSICIFIAMNMYCFYKEKNTKQKRYFQQGKNSKPEEENEKRI